MKKYLLGIIAIVIAIGFSAFSNEKNKKTYDPVYYWYIVDGSGNIPSNATVQFGGTQTAAYADAADGCTGTQSDCLRGFLSQPSLPTSLPGDAQTKKN